MTMKLTIEEITRWAETSEVDEEFAHLQEEDSDWFDHHIIANCNDRELLRFAQNRTSTKRIIFTVGLVHRLVHYLYSLRQLPYQFSRFQGMIPFAEYRTAQLAQLEQVYERCRVVEEMRNSEQEEIKNLGNMILDYRHDRRLSHASTAKFLQLLNYQIEQSFRTGVTTHTARICKRCNGLFKSWIADGSELEAENCPFCKLEIVYPQKSGRNRN
ncbi:hypothetical protein [Anatilimnocola floriformis]|uniref:hypothetical protein n=1 Tax=Anatilimnocola floriformis TaxID=2948575 RepID=UPI0020C5031F|nr:hypothetical protein [Anatilimnocola floriformis]